MSNDELGLTQETSGAPEGAGLEDVEEYRSLCAKCREVQTSDRMGWIVSTVLGQDWVTHPRASGGFSITSDGFVVSGGLFVGSLEDFQGNILGFLTAAGVTAAEFELFRGLYSLRVSTWQPGHYGDPAILPALGLQLGRPIIIPVA